MRLVGSSLLLLAALACNAQGTEGRTYKFAQQALLANSIFFGYVEWKNLPPKKAYQELSPEERRIFHDCYEAIAEGDEPPYPANGLEPMFQRFMPLMVATRKSGSAEVFIDIDSSGKATSAGIGRGSDPVVAKILIHALLETHFKPAICGGRTCSMAFPHRVTVDLPYPN